MAWRITPSLCVRNNLPGPEGRLSGLTLAPEVIASLEAVLPRMAQRTVDAIIAEVPAYTDPFRGQMGQNLSLIHI